MQLRDRGSGENFVARTYSCNHKTNCKYLEFDPGLGWNRVNATATAKQLADSSFFGDCVPSLWFGILIASHHLEWSALLTDQY